MTGTSGVVAPSREDPVARVASAVVGGPAGSRLASTRGRWRAVPLLVLLAVAVLSLGVVQKQPCRAQGWVTPAQFWQACYSDVPALYGSAQLGGPDRPSLTEVVSEGTLQQPPLTSAALWLVSGTVDADDAQTAPRRFFDLSAFLLAGSLAVAVTCLALAAGRRRWDAAHLALAPVLVTAGLVSYDLLAVALLCAALLAWARSRPLAAGLLLGAAVAARPLAAVVGVAVVALALRAGRPRPAAVLVGAGLAAWYGVRLALVPGFGGGLGRAWETWSAGGPGYGSLWLVPQLLGQNRPRGAAVWYEGAGLGAGATTTLVLLGTAGVLGTVVVVALAARHRPRVAHLALFAVAGCLVVSRSVPVQASLLLLPLLALSALRWRDHLVWATTELTYFVGVWLFIAASSDASRGLPGGFYLVLLLARLAGIGWLAVQALRAALDPGRDPVRTPPDGSPGEDDPQGGELAGADDGFVVRFG